MSSCFFSSRLRMRISRTGDFAKRRSTAFPNEPVPPVISRVLSLNVEDIRRSLGISGGGRHGAGGGPNLVLFLTGRIVDQDCAILPLEHEEASGRGADHAALPEKRLDVAERSRAAQDRHRDIDLLAHPLRQLEVVSA